MTGSGPEAGLWDLRVIWDHLGTRSGGSSEVDSEVASEVILDPYLDPSEKPH